MITIVLWLWHDGPQKKWGAFNHEHVNRAAAMARANLAMPHEIACITDAPNGIDSSVRIIPLWPELAERGRCWRRLKAFAPEMGDIIGPRFAWMDLDMCVTGDLTPLFDRPEDIVLWKSQTTRCPINGSMILMTAGARPQVWTEYEPGKAFAPRYPGSDQAWISHALNLGGKEFGEATWDRKDGVLSYNRGGCRQTGAPPPHCRVVFFPGTVKSNSDIVRYETPWVQQTLEQYGAFEEIDYRWSPRHMRRRMMKRQPPAPKRERRGIYIRSWAPRPA